MYHTEYIYVESDFILLKDLKERLSNFPDNAKVRIIESTSDSSSGYFSDACLEITYRLDNK